MHEIRARRSIKDKKLSDSEGKENIYASSESEGEISEDLEKDIISSAKWSPNTQRKQANTANSINSEKSKISPIGVESYTNESALSSSHSPASGLGIIRRFRFIILVIILFCLVATGYVLSHSQSEQKKVKFEAIVGSRKNCSFSKLQNKYKTQDKILWKSLKIGIEGILNEENDYPSVVLFLIDNNKSKEIVIDIAQTSSQCFDPNSNPVEIDATNFTSKEAVNDYGVIIQMYKEKIKESSVVIIANLNEIPPEAAKSLHAICDTYSPIANDVVIFLTLIPINEKGKLTKIAEKTLENMWSSKIPDHELQPLIARVTDQVLRIKPLENIS